MDSSAYRQAASSLFDTWLENDKHPSSLEPLAEMLGCRYLVYNFGYTLKEPPPPSPRCASVVNDMLMKLLLQHNPYSILARKVEHTLLDGLLRNDRWRCCLDQLSTAHAFVAILADFIERGAGNLPAPSVRVFHKIVADQLDPVLCEWLGPASGQAGYTRRLFAAALFGQAWCHLVLDRYPSETPLAEIIRETCPRFMAGLVVAQSESTEEVLPELAET
jgi:hypothetical protein